MIQMTDRERLIELLDQKQTLGCATETGINYIQNSELADYLIAHGVTVSPCKVGDTVYQFDAERIYESRIRNVIYETNGIAFDEQAIGKTVFLTREEAERALKENKRNEN